MLEVLIIILLL